MDSIKNLINQHNNRHNTKYFKPGDKCKISKIPDGFSCEFMFEMTGCKTIQELSNKIFIVDDAMVVPLNDGNYLEEVYLENNIGPFNNEELIKV